MPTQSKRQTENYHAPAGIIALTRPDIREFSPHREVIHQLVSNNLKLLERHCQVASQLTQAFTDIIDGARQLQSVQREFHSLVWEEAPLKNSFFGLSSQTRLDLYSDGLHRGFDYIKKMLKGGARPYKLKGRTVWPNETLTFVERCQAIESKRSTILSRISGNLGECLSHIERNDTVKAVLREVAARSGDQDPLQHEVTLKRIAKLFAPWPNVTEVSNLFALPLSGLIDYLEQLNTALQPRINQDIPTLAHKITIRPAAQPLISASVNATLNNISQRIREATLPAKFPDIEIYRTLFSLRLLQGELPQQERQDRNAALIENTSRLVRSFRIGEFLGAVERHKDLNDDDKELVIRHSLEVQAALTRPHDSTSRAPFAPLEKRTEVRRHINERLEMAETEEREQEIHARVDQLRDLDPSRDRTQSVEVSYYPTSIEGDLKGWLSAYPEATQQWVFGVIQRAAEGAMSCKRLKTAREIKEIRGHDGGGIRIYFTRPTSTEFVVLGFGLKQTQKHDITLAVQRFRALKRGE